jgi:fatty-acyl-CoA synthase
MAPTNIVSRGASREWFPKQTIGALVDERAARDGAREAVSFRGERWSFRQLAAEVDRVARGLMALGIEPGEKVSLWMVNRPEWMVAALAIIKIGAVLIPINTRFRTEDVRYVVGHSDSVALIIAERAGPVDYLGMARELLPSVALSHVIALGDAPAAGTVPWPAMLAAGDRVLTFDDVILMYLPLYHLFGFSEGMLISLATGARQVLVDVFDPMECLRLLEQERATILHGFDTHFKDLMEAHERVPRDVSSVRTGVLASGMSSSFPIARKARRLFGPLVSGYGMSEFCVGVTLSFPTSTEEQCVEASGYPAPGYEIRIVDPATGTDQPVGVPGEILVRGYTMMQGYYKKADETATFIDPDGWAHTGDMGLLRSDGHLRFLGRYKDMLKIGGENVDPMEVEAFLMTHPAINLAAVVAYPDARLSEVAVAFVRLEPAATLTEADAIDYCRGKIASFKIPRHVLVVEDFPWTGSGKIQKVKLREEARRRLPLP